MKTHRHKFVQRNRFHIIVAILLALSFFIVGCSSTAKEKKVSELNVYAAASLTDVMQKLTQKYQEKYGCKININLASSGTLARQIEQGGDAEIYFSASNKWMNYVNELGLSNKEFNSTVAKNQLVAIVPGGSTLEMIQIEKELEFCMIFKGRLSIGDPAHVPAGNYAKQSLEYFHWFDSLSQRFLPAKDVRSALMMVELGEAELGIVYATDAKKSSKVKVIGTFPEESHLPIVYSAAIIGSTPSPEAKRFFQFIQGNEAVPVWQSFGFLR